MTSINRAASNYFRRLLPAALIAAAAALGVGIGDSAIAHAEPKELDMGQLEQCSDQVEHDVAAGLIEWEDVPAEKAKCCVNAGGTWDAYEQDCYAPPAEAAHTAHTLPSRVTQTFEPNPPPPARHPGNIAGTVEPAPVG